MTKLRRLARRILGASRPRVRVEITCPHGDFIPGVYRPGTMPRRYACTDCGFRVRLSAFWGEVAW